MDIKGKFKKLQAGEEVKCSNCENGLYRPVGIGYDDLKKCHQFKCDMCDNYMCETVKLVL